MAHARRRPIIAFALVTVALTLTACAGVTPPGSDPGGRWTPVADQPDRPLDVVSCVDRTFCLGAGDGVEIFDGTRWTPAPGSAALAEVGGFASVSCASRAFCVVAGPAHRNTTVPDEGAGGARLARFDGTSFRVVPFPGLDPDHPAAVRVSCSSAQFCLAVAVVEEYSTNVLTTVAARWDGTAWSALAAPSIEPTDLSCTGPSECVTVGYPTGSRDVDLERWDGAAWTPTTLPLAPGSLATILDAVSCPAAGRCLATGDAVTPTGYAGAYTATWDGRSWSGSADNDDRAVDPRRRVSCASTPFCLAAGGGPDSAGDPAGYGASAWDGQGWAPAPAPPVGPEGSVTFGGSLSCRPDWCLAVSGRTSAVYQRP